MNDVRRGTFHDILSGYQMHKQLRCLFTVKQDRSLITILWIGLARHMLQVVGAGSWIENSVPIIPSVKCYAYA